MKQKQYRIDNYLGRYKWYRKLRKGYWYKHRFNNYTYDGIPYSYKHFWARYGQINGYSVVIEQEIY